MNEIHVLIMIIVIFEKVWLIPFRSVKYQYKHKYFYFSERDGIRKKLEVRKVKYFLNDAKPADVLELKLVET